MINRKQKKKTDDFDDLARELGQDTFFRRLKSLLTPYRYLLLFLLVIVIGGTSYFAWTAYKNRNLSPQELKTYTDNLVEPPTELTWTIQDYLDIKVDAIGEKGELLDAIIKKFGKGSTVDIPEGYEAIDGFLLVYETDGSESYVIISFKKVKGEFRAFDKHCYFEVSDYPDKEKSDKHALWTQQKFDDLKIGDVLTSEGSTSLDQIVQEFDYANKTRLSYLGDDGTLYVDYIEVINGKTVTLAFEEYQGDYFLKSKFLTGQ